MAILPRLATEFLCRNGDFDEVTRAFEAVHNELAAWRFRVNAVIAALLRNIGIISQRPLSAPRFSRKQTAEPQKQLMLLLRIVLKNLADKESLTAQTWSCWSELA